MNWKQVLMNTLPIQVARMAMVILAWVGAYLSYAYMAANIGYGPSWRNVFALVASWGLVVWLDRRGRIDKEDIEKAYAKGQQEAMVAIADDKHVGDCPYGDMRGRAFVWGYSSAMDSDTLKKVLVMLQKGGSE